MVRKKKRIAKKRPAKKKITAPIKKKSTKKKLPPKKQTSQEKSAETRAKRGYPKFEKFKKLIMSDLCITPTDAAMQSYNCKDRNVASSIASENLRKLEITMPEVLKRMGLTDEEDAEDLKRLRKAKTTKFFQHEGKITDSEDVEDNATQLKALELTGKFKGNLINKMDHSGEIKGEANRIIIIRADGKPEKE